MDKDPQKYWQTNNQWFDQLYTKANYFDKLLRKAVYYRMAVAAEVCAELHAPTVLDIGCGSGHVAQHLLTHAGASHVTGIDFSSSMLALARDLLAQNHLTERTRLIEGDIFEKDLAVGGFDLVIALGVFDYVATAGELWNRMVGLAKNAIVASFPAPDFPRANLRRFRYGLRGCPVYFYTCSDLEKLLGQSPTMEVTFRQIQAGHVVIAKRREKKSALLESDSLSNPR